MASSILSFSRKVTGLLSSKHSREAHAFIFQTDSFFPVSFPLFPPLLSLPLFVRQRSRRAGGPEGGPCRLQAQRAARAVVYSRRLRRDKGGGQADHTAARRPGFWIRTRAGLGWGARPSRPPAFRSALASVPGQWAPGRPRPPTPALPEGCLPVAVPREETGVTVTGFFPFNWQHHLKPEPFVWFTFLVRVSSFYAGLKLE